MRIFAVLLWLPVLALAGTKPLHPTDFAYGMTLQGDGAGALFAFDLPDDVYRHTLRSDLGDMRIFNGNGEVVPHLLQHKTESQEIRQSVTLPFFPLFADEVNVKGETTLRIMPGQQGAVIDLRSQAARDDKDRTVSHYIIDASALKQPIRRFTLQWQANSETFISTLVVEQSSDLSHWRPLTTATLAELLYGSERLQRNEITLPSGQQPFLRISWPMGSKGVTLAMVEAEVAQPGVERALNWSDTTSHVSDETIGRYDFEVNGHYPVERLKVVLPQDNTMVRAKLLSSADPQGNRWTVRYQGVLYSLLHEGKRLESGELTIATTSDRYWRLEVAQEGGGIGAGTPQLKLGWYPHRAVFVARGSSPFTLAFGSAYAGSEPQDQGLTGWLAAQRSGADEIAMKNMVPQAMQLLGGEQQLQPAPPPLPWKKWLLWAVLVAGVLAMLGMARGLYRQMNRA